MKNFFRRLFRKKPSAIVENQTSVGKNIKIKYPDAKTVEHLSLMKSIGNYPKGYPEGIIVHFTGGHTEQEAKDAITFANKMGHSYFFIDEWGFVYQQFCLSKWGSHAGVSKCPVTNRQSVSKYYVGIEIANEGSLRNDNTTDFGKKIPREKIRTGEINNKWQKVKGKFKAYRPAQEKSLIDLCVWLCREFKFNEEFIFGHDEVAPNRKNDPGLSLSYSMDEFRELIRHKLNVSKKKLVG